MLSLLGLFAVSIGAAQVFDLSPSRLFDLITPSADGTLPRSAPVRVTIPSIDVRASVVKVGQAADGSIATPDGDPARTTGWYSPGPSPGEPGTAVIVGHIDTKSQPAVFARLSQLTAGATITVRRNDWKTATFTVDSLELYPKTKFPADKVFQRADKPRLALITCGGDWVGGDVGYADNLIVMATMT